MPSTCHMQGDWYCLALPKLAHMISRIFCHQSWYDASYHCLCVQSSMSSPLHHFSYRRLSALICLQTPVCLSSCFGTSFSAAPIRCLISLFVCAVLRGYVITFTPFFISSPECAHLSPNTCKPLIMFWHLILCCPSPYCIPHAIIKCRMTILISYFPCLAARCFHVKTAWFVCWHHSLPTFGSEIALHARMLAPSFAGSPRCAFTLTKKVAVHAAILFRSISMAAARISAPSGAPTNVAFPPSPIHLVTAFNNDWLSHKYSNGSSISVSRSASRNAANSGRFELEPSSSRPTLHCCFSFFLLKLSYPAPILPFLSEPSPAVTWPWNSQPLSMLISVPVQ